MAYKYSECGRYVIDDGTPCSKDLPECCYSSTGPYFDDDPDLPDDVIARMFREACNRTRAEKANVRPGV
jgi:hypothetical protein